MAMSSSTIVSSRFVLSVASGREVVSDCSDSGHTHRRVAWAGHSDDGQLRDIQDQACMQAVCQHCLRAPTTHTHTFCWSIATDNGVTLHWGQGAGHVLVGADVMVRFVIEDDTTPQETHRNVTQIPWEMSQNFSLDFFLDGTQSGNPKRLGWHSPTSLETTVN